MNRLRQIIRLSISVLLIASQTPLSWAGENPFSIFEEEAQVVIATRNKQSLEMAPSIVSVVTRNEIERYGHRDLGDILRSIPGFEFGIDVFSEAGPTFRGIWVEEGKSLLMINGITQNELGYGTFSFFGSIPASMIEKVEIIRGPGSALYGGFAEVDVINVITHQPENLNGMRVSASAGTVGKGGSSHHGNISYGNQTNDLRVAAHVGQGSTLLSTREYTDFFGNRIKLNKDNSSRNWKHIITEAESKNLTLRYQRTSFEMGAQDTFTTIQPPINGNNLEVTDNYNDVTYLDYKAKLTDKLTLQPLFEYTRNNTWNFKYPASIDGYLEGSGTSLWRTKGEMMAIYETPWSGETRVGGGILRDDVENIASDGTPGLQLSPDPADLSSRVHTTSIYGFFQHLQQMNPFGLTVGARYEDTDFGSAFAPRTGLTYTRSTFNAKLLYGKAFRIPLPWQAYSRVLSFNGDLKPETASTTELEVGYKFTPQVIGKINTFLIHIDEPIVYLGATNKYVNLGHLDSRGVEAELHVRYAHFGGFANASYAVPGSNTSPGFIAEPKKKFIGIAPLKLNTGIYYKIGKMEFAPSVTYLSHSSGQSRESANNVNGTLGTTGYRAVTLTNINVTARELTEGLDIHLSVHNIFNSRYVLIQPYYGSHAPIPAQDREISLGVTYRL